MPKRKRVELLVYPAAALLLELLPIGVRMNWAPGPEGRIVTRCAYFNMLPFGYGVFGPVIAALLTIFIMVTALFTWRQERLRAVPAFSGAALLAALSPLFYVRESFTLCGGFICLLLALELVFSLLPERS